MKHRGHAQRKSSRKSLTMPLGVESLETRCLLSAAIDNGVLNITGTSGHDVISVIPGNANEVQVKMGGVSQTFNTSAFNSISIKAGAGDDIVDISEAIKTPAVIDGEDGNDSLVGGAGNDTLDGGAGGDTMHGGDGNDTVDYSSRTNGVYVGIGTLSDDGEAGEHDNVYLDVETVIGGSGNDTIHGGAGDNLLVGNDGDDQLFGNYGNDTLSGDAGTDTLNGEDGTDTAINSTGDTLISIEVNNNGGGNTGSISGIVFNDSNTDGAFDSGDLPLASRTVFIDANNNGKLDAGEMTATTNSSGVYTFTGLAAGTYIVGRSDTPAGYSYTEPEGGFYSITLTAGQSITGKDIGDFLGTISGNTGSISGTVFNDANENGAFDAGDTPLASRIVFIDANNNGKLDAGEMTATTNSSGVYTFTNLTQDNYVIRRADTPAGYVYSEPVGGAWRVFLDAREVVSGKDIGDFQSHNPGTPGTVTSYIANRVLIIEGTDGADDIGLASNNDAIDTDDGSFNRVDFDSILVQANGGDDRITLQFVDQIPVSIEGGAGNDVVQLIASAASFNGGDGNDTIGADDATEVLGYDGGAGIDKVIADGDGTIDLTQYPTVEDAEIREGEIIGNNLDNHLTLEYDGTLMGGDGNDTLQTLNDNSTMLDGGDGNDTITASQGNDSITGGDGNDSIMGGDGDDTIDGGAGSDFMSGGDGNDTVTYASRTNGVYVGIGTLNDDGEAGEHDNVYLDVETVIGGSGNDTIHGSDGDNLLVGNDGDDQLFGGAGNDTLSGDSGTDTLNGEAGTDTAINDAGDTLISIENDLGGTPIGPSVTITPDRTLLITGTSGDDTISFAADVSVKINGVIQEVDPNAYDRVDIQGLGGNDTIVVGGANMVKQDAYSVTLDGGDGNDTLQLSDAGGYLIGGAGDDTYQLTATWSVEGISDVSGKDTVDMASSITENFDLTKYPTIENVVNGVGLITGNSLDNDLSLGDLGGTLLGNGGNDTLNAELYTLSTSLDGGTGNDTITGGAGNDSITGGDGNDSIMGGAGDDTIDGGLGSDFMSGGDGNDTVTYASRTNGVYVGIGTLNDDGEAGEHDNVYLDVETVIGGSGNDTIHGGAGDNLLVGNDGDDQLFGNYGNDTLSGDAGTDTLNGEVGDDTAINATGDTLISIEQV